MNYLQIIKQALYDEEKRRGCRNQVAVDSRALRLLVEDYERMESFARSSSDTDMHVSLAHKLLNVLTALYHENHDSERLMLLVMEILKPMIEDRIKSVMIDNIYYRP